MNKEEELLRNLRGHLSHKRGLSAHYMIFRDEELYLLLKHKPKSIGELSKIKGFPRDGKRVAGYGDAIVAVFKNSSEVKDFKVVDTKDGNSKLIPVIEKLSIF